MLKDIFMLFLPIIVLLAGLVICNIVLWVINKKKGYIEKGTVFAIVATIMFTTIVGSKLAVGFLNTYRSENAKEKANSYYAEIDNLIQNGYIVYINGSVVDFNKVVISDYPTDKIHINYELKEVYIGSSN